MSMHAEPRIPQRVFQRYVEQFKAIRESEALKRIRQRKWGKVERAKSLIQEDTLRELTLAQAEELYRCLPVPQQGRSVFLTNPIEEIREALSFLLYEQLMYEIRVYEFLDQGGWLKGGNLSLAAALLCAKDSDLYGPISSNTEKGLKVLEMVPIFDKNESQAGRFQKLQETLFYLYRISGLHDLRETDDFLEALAKGILKPSAG
ncbi:MAG: hypothetical protein HY532_01200 [Chloroflexi bacterium]|nr:hypothetical protein [Chloroflexota bacterium]